MSNFGDKSTVYILHVAAGSGETAIDSNTYTQTDPLEPYAWGLPPPLSTRTQATFRNSMPLLHHIPMHKNKLWSTLILIRPIFDFDDRAIVSGQLPIVLHGI